LKTKLAAFFGNPYVELACRLFLGGLFVYSCVHKIMHPADMAKVIYGYKIMPGVTINVLAIMLPFFELVCGLCLVFGIWPRSAAVLINGMLLIFIVAISYNLMRGLQFDCGCFGFHKAGEFSDPRELLVRDMVYFGITLVVILYQGTRKFTIKTKNRCLILNKTAA